MATYSSNTTLKVDSAISAAASRTSIGTTTIYTNPSATGYAILNVFATSGASSMTVQVAGRDIGATGTFLGVILGPSQSIAINQTGASGGTQTVQVTGVLIVNS